MKGERETSTMKEGLTQKKEVERERERKRVNCSGRRRGREKAGRKKRMRQIIRIHELRFLVTYCLYLFLLNIYTVCLRSSYLSHRISYHIKWVSTSWT